ncbi:MAG: IS66 family transposase [Actinomycetota bacterium]|jgi:transposase|nr:IS66 family transposase [Actinomycetota bacterium]
MAPVGPPDHDLDAPLPGCCPYCGGEVVHERDDEQFQTDLPERTATVTRFRVGVGHCTRCKRRFQGRHLEQTSDALGAAASQLGPNAKSLATWLHYVMGLSFEKTAGVLSHFGVAVTAGALASGAKSTGTALEPVHQEIIARVNDAEVVTADETASRVGGRRTQLWTAASAEATAYNVAVGCSYEHALEILNEDFSGILVRDGYGVYRLFEQATHQSCNAHLLRRAHGLAEDNPPWARATPQEVTDILKTGLGARGYSERTRRKVAKELTERVEILAGTEQPYDANRRLVNHLMVEKDALFTFLTNPGVEATNWRAEQAIRPAVVNRKVWGGNRTWDGARTQSRIMSVMRTALQRGLDPIEYLVKVARAPAGEPVWLFYNTQ